MAGGDFSWSPEGARSGLKWTGKKRDGCMGTASFDSALRLIESALEISCHVLTFEMGGF